MSKANGIINAIGKVITWLLIVLLVLGIAGTIAYFALRGQGVTFYVEYNNMRYFANGDGGAVWFPPENTETISVKSLLGEDVNYSAKVETNGANNFSFTTNGEIWHLWNDDTEKDDYTDIFGIEKNADSFTITIPADFSVEKAVEEKFGSDIVLQSEIQDDLCYFVLVISVDDSTVRLPFLFSYLTITFNPPSIVF